MAASHFIASLCRVGGCHRWRGGRLRAEQEAEKRLQTIGYDADVTHSSDRLFNYSIGYITHNSIYIDDKYYTYHCSCQYDQVNILT